MTLAALAVTLLFGLVVGLLSGLVGIGGGAAMVPFLYILFEQPAFSGVSIAMEHQAVVAHATSLLVIIPTALSGLREYQKARLVDWSMILPMAAGTVAAAVVGALVAERLPPELLKGGFGIFLFVTGARLLRSRRPRETSLPPGNRLRNGALYTACGAAVGLFSAVLGVGGGLVAIPLLIYVLHIELRRVAATSIGLVVFAGVAGTITYGFAGWGAPGLPTWTWGYVFLPVALALIPGAVLGARWGAAVNQRTDARLLAVVFAVLFLAMGARLVVTNVWSLV